MDAAGRIVASFTVKHPADGIAGLIRRPAGLGEAGDIPIGIERPSGRLVDLLPEAGHPVVPASPNAIKTWREGEVPAGAKSDAADAAVIAEYLRLRQHRLRTATPSSGQTKALRTVVRTRDDLVVLRVAAVNQLAALPGAHWPGAKAIFADNSWHAGPWAAQICNNARKAGKDHPHAIRVLARAWIRVIWRCRHDGAP
ncbi:IS110 family transposase [Actinomadura formosensis]|uniref:IS110 family transposase n=1 Tax=Actinomadura formosensis TaxID=60706 RepID=UPI003D8DD974